MWLWKKEDGQGTALGLTYLHPLLEAAPTDFTGLVPPSHQEAALGGNGPHKKQEARAHSNKTLKEAIISGLPLPAQSTSSQISRAAVIASGCWQN